MSLDGKRSLAELRLLLVEPSTLQGKMTDYNLPEMDDQALIEYLRTKSWQNSVPVIMVTSETNEGRLAAVQGMGVVGVCDKPFEPSTVKGLLRSLMA